MASTKISDMTAATDLTGAVIPIVQGGVNKKADAGLFGFSDLTENTSFDLSVYSFTILSENAAEELNWRYEETTSYQGLFQIGYLGDVETSQTLQGNSYSVSVYNNINDTLSRVTVNQTSVEITTTEVTTGLLTYQDKNQFFVTNAETSADLINVNISGNISMPNTQTLEVIASTNIDLTSLALFLRTLPTNPSGLEVDQVYNDNGTLKIVLP
jgi:hypothetical protein